MAVDPETLSGRRERGYYHVFPMGESLDSVIVSHLWTPNSNRRKLRDCIVIRDAFDPAPVARATDQLPPTGFRRRIDGNRRKYNLGRFVEMASSINRLVGAPYEAITMYRAPIEGIEAHLDCDSVGADINCRRSEGVVLSLGLRGNRYLGFSPILRHWQVLDGEVYAEDGNGPTINTMRTVVCQNPGDVVVIPGGIVHVVEAERNTSAVLVAQNNQYSPPN